MSGKASKRILNVVQDAKALLGTSQELENQNLCGENERKTKNFQMPHL